MIQGLVSLAEAVASSGPLTERLESLCRIATRLIGCDRSSLFVLEGEHYRGIANYGNPPDVAERFPRHRVSARDRLVRAALSQGSPVIVNDVPGSTLVHADTARIARIRAIVVASVLDESGESIGFQTAEYNENRGRFDETESALLSGVARLAGVAIDRDRVARERLELDQKLQRQERLQALGRLAAGVAHDFNNLLAVIIGYADLLRDDLARAPTMRRELDHLRAAADRAASLTAKLLAFAGAELSEPKSVDPERLVAELEPLLRRTIGEDIELRRSVESPLPNVHVDPRALENALVNLVANARDALPRGGRIEIAMRPTEGESPGVSVAVIDDGEGMDVATRERALEPFFTTKSTGTGLGLAAVSQTVHRAGGQMHFESEPGRGTRVELILPACEPAAERASPTARAPARAARSGTVLLVEDEPALREMMQRTLARDGHRVLAFGAAETAFRHASALGDAIDLLVTDLVLPDASGADLARRLRDLDPALPVVLISGYAEERALRSAAELVPAPEFLPKPFAPARLAEIARTALEQGAVH